MGRVEASEVQEQAVKTACGSIWLCGTTEGSLPSLPLPPDTPSDLTAAAKCASAPAPLQTSWCCASARACVRPARPGAQRAPQLGRPPATPQRPAAPCHLLAQDVSKALGTQSMLSYAVGALSTSCCLSNTTRELHLICYHEHTQGVRGPRLISRPDILNGPQLIIMRIITARDTTCTHPQGCHPGTTASAATR